MNSIQSLNITLQKSDVKEVELKLIKEIKEIEINLKLEIEDVRKEIKEIKFVILKQQFIFQITQRVIIAIFYKLFK